MKLKVSLVSPAFCEAKTLPIMYGEICKVFQEMPCRWEWVIIDDHSTDDTFSVAHSLARKDSKVRVFRLSKNVGSHMGVVAGLRQCEGEVAIIMSSDLQDPPEIIPQLIDQWGQQNDIVWAKRRSRPGESRSTLFFSRCFHWVSKKLLPSTPPSGSDCFLVDRKVIEAVSQFREQNLNILNLIAWLGYKQSSISFDKHPRIHGTSKWTWTKKIKLFIDSMISFSYLPIRLMSLVGILVALCGLLYAVYVFSNAPTSVTGWSSLMIAILILGGGNLLMMGVLGEYIWRSLEESRGRPRFFIEASSENTPLRPQRDGASAIKSPTLSSEAPSDAIECTNRVAYTTNPS